MKNYVMVLTVFAHVKKEKGAFEYYKTRHDKKTVSFGELEVIGSK